MRRNRLIHLVEKNSLTEIGITIKYLNEGEGVRKYNIKSNYCINTNLVHYSKYFYDSTTLGYKLYIYGIPHVYKLINI